LSVEVLPLSSGNREPRATVSINRQDFAKYAGASGDFTPLHVDEEFAQAAGYDSVFAMGMLTAGIAGSFVNQWLGVENIKEFEVRFESIVFPGDELTYTAEVLNERDGRVTAEFTTTDQEGDVVLTGETTALNSAKEEL